MASYGRPRLADGQTCRPGGWPNRSMSDPPSIGNYPDRWSERKMSEYPDTGISSKAVFLLTVGGQHPDTGVSVQGIGNTKARFLYYMVLQELPSSGTSRPAGRPWSPEMMVPRS